MRRINRNIVECKGDGDRSSGLAASRINRNIVECKADLYFYGDIVSDWY